MTSRSGGTSSGVVVIVAVLLIVPKHHQSVGFIFFHFNNSTGANFPGDIIYVFLIGLLLAQYTFTGYDASAHMTEETRNAAVAGPRGIVMSIVVSLVRRLDPAHRRHVGNPELRTGVRSPSVPAAQVFLDAAGGGLGQFLLLIAIGAQFYCGMSSVTANSRMIFAFSRDGAVPGHQLWSKINKRTRTPTNSIWLAVVGAFILWLPYLYNPAAVFRGHLDRRHRSVHRVRHPDLPAPARRRLLPARPVAPRAGGAVPIGIVAVVVDLPDQHPVRPSDGLPGHPRQLQLHDRRVRGRARRHHDLVVRVGEELVQGPPGSGHAEELASIEAGFVDTPAPVPAVSAG